MVNSRVKKQWLVLWIYKLMNGLWQSETANDPFNEKKRGLRLIEMKLFAMKTIIFCAQL